jgi:hypothetical protein
MSTQTIEQVDSIEHLDHTPACEGTLHKNVPPAAQFWVNIHGCKAKFACAGCVAYDRSIWVNHGGRKCSHCMRFFSTFESAEWVTPL